ncbi:MAG: ABC transporter permease, partial [Hyphomicrobiales bacterium]|nr:ABC transporter permease [Hyphomicrobiales bacterium]
MRDLTTRFGAALLTAPLLIFLALAYVVPFLGIVQWSFTLPEPGIGQYGVLLTDPLVQSVFLRTLRICLAVTVASVVCAYVLAFVWVRGTPTQRMIAEFCILVPFWISLLTRAFGWVALLSNRGLINTWLTDAGLIELPLRLVHNFTGTVIGMV